MKLSTAQQEVLDYIHVCAGQAFPPMRQVQVLMGAYRHKSTLRSIEAMERKGVLKIISHETHCSGPSVQVELLDPYIKRVQRSGAVTAVVYYGEEFQLMQQALRDAISYVDSTIIQNPQPEALKALVEKRQRIEQLLVNTTKQE